MQFSNKKGLIESIIWQRWFHGHTMLFDLHLITFEGLVVLNFNSLFYFP